MSPSVDGVGQIADGVVNASITSSSRPKPNLVLVAAPVAGHTTPMITLTSELVHRGFIVTFIGGEEYRKDLEVAGAEVVGLDPVFTAEFNAKRELVPVGIPRLMYDVENVFIGQTEKRWIILKDVLEKLRENDPAMDVVIVAEPLFMGTNPLLLGAPLPKGYTSRPKVISFNQLPYLGSSVVTGPFGLGLPPDGSETCGARNMVIKDMMVHGPFAGPIAMQRKTLMDLGVPDSEVLNDFPMDLWFSIPDVILQMCPPSFEYVRPDAPSHFKFAGFLPQKPLKADIAYPTFWREVVCGNKRVVVVTQGTVAVVLTDLLIPSLQALADRDDLLVVAILGQQGIALPEDVVLPANARVVDYLPYDAILPHAAAFIMNGGYGGVIHGINHGVPMVLAGDTEDKPEVGMRAEHAGFAVNLRTGKPKPKAIRDALDQVLTDPSFKKKIVSVKAESEALGAMKMIEAQITEFAGK
jgi:UDP:flavonoid glycosyltransferase YjiC (YdhE family)